MPKERPMPLTLAPLRLSSLLLGFTLGLTGTAGAQQEPPPLDLATYPRTELTITQAKPPAVHAFRVWVADTEPRAQQGLMFVRDLPESEGMIFPLEPPRVETMWMKNTYIELDMLFIDAAGRVVKIIERAHPLSLDTLSSGGPVSAVLELKGGLAAKLALHAGDKVSWKKPAG
jgi:uncharacterized membrane protein (UPF0127 family)